MGIRWKLGEVLEGDPPLNNLCRHWQGAAERIGD